MVKCLPEFEYFTVFLKNNNIIFKIRRSKVTDYAALSHAYTQSVLVQYWSRHEKPVFGVGNNKGADQPVHPHRLISSFVIRF